MPAELVQGLAILEMELIEEGAPIWIGQSFEDSVLRFAIVYPRKGQLTGFTQNLQVS